MQSACMLCPARGLEKFDPSVIRLVSAPGVHADAQLPANTPGRWTRAILEIRPDGTPALWINGELIAEGAIRLQDRARRSWHVTLKGDSTEPPLLVRNVGVWVGVSSTRETEKTSGLPH